jgi:predicted lipid-binding transport protein (Tim44 family)
MGEGFQTLDIILFAMIAAFLVLRLRSVLGKKTGHQRPPVSQSDLSRDDSDENLVRFPGSASEEIRSSEPGGDINTEDPLEASITEVRIADPSFSPTDFLNGARGAFEMVVQAYANGDRDTLRTLLNDEVFEDFATAIDAREKSEETLDFTLIGLKDAALTEARVSGRMAFVTIQFVSEQVNVTRDKDQKVIAGDPNSIETVTDIWTFARNTRASDPNWTLVETRTPEEV